MNSQQLDRSALVWGAVFTVLGGTFLLEEAGVWSVRAGVLVPVLLIVAGLVLVLSGTVSKEST